MSASVPTQSHRNVAISTTLGPDKLLIQSASITEQIARLTQIEVELTTDDANISYDKIVGTNATIRLELNQKSTRYFNGLVSRFVLTQVDKGFAHYRMTLVPWLWFLTRTSDCQIFQKKSVPDIIQDVVREHGFSDLRLALTGHYDPWDYCVQYRETDFNFISRLMEHEGIYYYFEHENGKHTLVLADSPTAHKPKAGVEKVVFRPNPDGAKDKDYIHSFLVEQEVQPGRYVLNEFNFEKPKTSLKGQTDHSKSHAKADFEIYDYPGEYEESSHGKDYTQLRIEELHAQHETARGQTNDRAMATGATFTLGEFPRQDWNKKYLITSTSIHITNDEYESGGQSGGDFYSCSFTAIPASTQYRAPRLTPKPLIQGVQTAIVTGPKGEEIYVDDHARVKVQFHWDRRGQRDENSSCWVRVSQAWAGKGYGFISHPRIGQEVIVDFEEGDPDRPIITGRVYNADQKQQNPNAGRDGKAGNVPPANQPQTKMMTSFKSNSTGGGGGSNEITMNDTGGAEGLFLKAQKDEIHKVGNDREDTVGNNETRKVSVNRKREVGNNETVTIGTNQSVSVGVNRSITVAANETKTINVCRFLNTMLANNDFTGVMRGIETGAVRLDFTGLAAADIVGLARCTISGLIHYQLTGLYRTERVGLGYTLKAGTSAITEAGEKAGIKAGTKIVIEAPDITLKGAGGHIRIDGSGITIKGTHVKINSGGSPGSLDDDEVAAAAAGAAGSKGAAAAPGAAASGYQSELTKLLDKLGVPDKYLKVLDGLLNDPFNIPFADLKAIAPSMGDLLSHIPKELLPEKLRGPVGNLLKLLSSELAPENTPEQKQQNEADRKAALDGLTKEGKDLAEEYAKKHGLDLDKITGGDGTTEKPGNTAGSPPSTGGKTDAGGEKPSVSNLTDPSTARATTTPTGQTDESSKGVPPDVSQTIANNAETVAADYRDRGVTYKMGGSAADDGTTSDCSHYVHNVMQQSGVDVPYESTGTIGNSTAYTEVDPSEARAGDVVVQGGHMGIHSGSTDDKGRTNATQMGNHGAAPGKFGPDGYFNPDQPMKIYRPKTRDIS